MQKFVLNNFIGGFIDNTFGKFFEIFTEPLKYFLIICAVIIAIVIIYYGFNKLFNKDTSLQQPQMGYQYSPQMGYQPMNQPIGQTGGLKLVKK